MKLCKFTHFHTKLVKLWMYVSTKTKFKNLDKILNFCLEGDLNPPSLVFQVDTQICEAFQIFQNLH